MSKIPVISHISGRTDGRTDGRRTDFDTKLIYPFSKEKSGYDDPQKKHRLGTVSYNILLEGLNRFSGAPTSLINGVDPDQTAHIFTQISPRSDCSHRHATYFALFVLLSADFLKN